MAEPVIFRGPADPALARLVVAHLRTIAGQSTEIVIRKPRTKRSLDQNAYWWAVPVALLAEHCGNTPSQMHYALLGERFGYVTGPLGQPVPVKPSSSDLTVEEFTGLIEWVLIFGPAELGVVFPTPGEWEATR
jgi:hypothetical protein